MDCLNDDKSKKVIEKLHQSIKRQEIDLESKKSPYEKGLVFSVPGLAIRQGNFFEMFEESHFLNRSWDILSYDCTLTDSDYTPSDETGKIGEITISDNGQIKSRCITELQEQISLFENIDTEWSVADLVHWLDKNIKHPDISPMKSIPFINGAILSLVNEKKISINQLVVDRYKLKNSLEEKINLYREKEKENNYQICLFGQDSNVLVNPSICFDFTQNPYPASSYYDGGYEFQKHYYEHVGELKSKGEEFECAQFLDLRPEVEYWVRNLSKKQGSFWLQTSSDKFYPDFVCLLKNGQYLVVEYKGEDRYTNKDSEEKRILGELWEKRSNGKCLFIMPKGNDLNAIVNKIKRGS